MPRGGTPTSDRARRSRRSAGFAVSVFLLAAFAVTAGLTANWGAFWLGAATGVAVFAAWMLGELTARRIRRRR